MYSRRCNMAKAKDLLPKDFASYAQSHRNLAYKHLEHPGLHDQKVYDLNHTEIYQHDILINLLPKALIMECRSPTFMKTNPDINK